VNGPGPVRAFQDTASPSDVTVDVLNGRATACRQRTPGPSRELMHVTGLIVDRRHASGAKSFDLDHFATLLSDAVDRPRPGLMTPLADGSASRGPMCGAHSSGDIFRAGEPRAESLLQPHDAAIVRFDMRQVRSQAVTAPREGFQISCAHIDGPTRSDRHEHPRPKRLA